MHKFPIVVVSLAAAVAAQDPQPVAKMVDAVAPSIVTVRVVAEIALPAMMGGEKHEMKEETLGTVVDKSGLVLVPTGALDPGAQMSMMFGGEAEVESSVTSLKVVIGNDNQELAATVVAKDDKLGFSYVQIKELGDRQLTPLVFDQKVDLELGAELYTVRRQPEGYDFAPFVARLFVAGKIKKPRNAWVLDGGADVGSPVFTTAGVLAGVVARMEVSTGGDDERGMMMRMLRGGATGGGTFAVSAQVAANSIAQALETAQKAAAEKPAEKPAEAPADGGK